MLDWYLNPPFSPIIKVHVFNYTNIEEFVSGADKKIRIEEVGPYVYEEQLQKINVQYNGDTITYYENRTHRFIPEMSGSCTENDTIIAPNIPFISAIPNVAKLSFFSKVGFNTLLSLTKPEEFQNIRIKDYFFGYRDKFMDLISKIKWDFTPEDVGILAPRRGISKKSVTTNSGLKNTDTIGEVLDFGGKTKLDIWKTDECNEISGYDGIFNGPNLIRNKQNTAVFLPELCRSLPLEYSKEEVVYENIPSYYYTAPENTFGKPSDQITNKYYCELKSVQQEHINGVLDVSDCIDGSPPIYASHPHFMEGDERLFHHFEGLVPNKSIHNSYAYLHPRFSMPVLGTSRMQLNLKLSHHKHYYSNYPNELILPLAWVETTSDVIPEEFKFKLYLSTVIVDNVEIILKYGSLLTFMVSISFHFYTLRNNFRIHHVTLS
ncbi:scavenger receptor class B member 1-like isoform X2 [Chironomus tepperi]